jgi:hypothetical protein
MSEVSGSAGFSPVKHPFRSRILAETAGYTAETSLHETFEDVTPTHPFRGGARRRVAFGDCFEKGSRARARRG